MALRAPDMRYVGRLATLLVLLSPSAARPQEFTQVQSLTSRLLFAKEDQAALQRQAERRRIEELDQRAQRQAALLEQQAASVQQLGVQLQVIRDEKALVDLAEAFDAAVLAGRASDARMLLADDVIIRLADAPTALDLSQAADAFIAGPTLASAAGAVLPRSNQRVRIDGDRAVLTSDGYTWGRPRSAGPNLDRRSGRWEYSFVRSAGRWKIERISFVRSPAY